MMGNYFVMSMRFNKCSAYDFGLIPKDQDTAINPKDNSIWIRAALYDFGWGKETGFYKAPLPNFDALFKLALYSTNRDDMYGAAAIILERFPDKLLSKCESMANDRLRKKDFKKLVQLFELKLPINRCSVSGKTFQQVQNDYNRWKALSKTASAI